MRRIPILGACSAVALATCAIATTAALATPPEFSPPFPNPFTSTSAATTLQTVGKVKVMCKADTNKGEVTGPGAALVRISFTGCTTTAVAGVLCQSPNGAPGEIVTELLLGTLGYVSGVPLEVGLDLSNPTGGPLAVFFCGALKGEVFGSVIGRVTPLNKVVKPGAHVTLKFAQKAGHQAITMFLGGPVDVPLTKLSGGPLEESGLASTDKLTFAAPIVIIA
jgi:hypothetical protein